MAKAKHKAKTKVVRLTQLGRGTAIPASPVKAVLEAVPNPHPDTDYVARFTAPEFTCLCPVTGQPDFAHFVIDYVPGKSHLESKSLKLLLASYRNHADFHEATDDRHRQAHRDRGSGRNICALPATGIRAAASPSTCSGNRASVPRMSGSRTRVFPPIAGAAKSSFAAWREGTMAKQFPRIEDAHRAFIERQHIFFTGSAAPTGRVNVSPKGMDAFRVLGPNRVAYLDLTGSGNETSAHVEACDDHRLTIMFCAFEGAPLILRLYGRGTIHRLGARRRTMRC